MSIATKTGDDGTTGLMYNRRVSKSHPRVEAYAGVDELNAALGMGRAMASDEFVKETLMAIQKDLITVMGELATMTEDRPRYISDGFPIITTELTARLDRFVQELEAQNIAPADWAMPGSNISSAVLEVARTVCRRAERRVCGLNEIEPLPNREIFVYLNRLSDVLWLLARWVEARPDGASAAAVS